MAIRPFYRFDLVQTRSFPKPRPYPVGPDGWIAVSVRLAAAPSRDNDADDPVDSTVLEIQALGGSPRALALAERLDHIARTLREAGAEVRAEVRLDDLLPPPEA